MKSPVLIFVLALLCTGFDAPAQDITSEPVGELESIGATCIALTVFAEARHRSWLEQALVARAILNRQAERGIGFDACDVVMEPGYSPALDAWAYPRRPWLIDEPAWATAMEVAQVVIADGYAFPRACMDATRFTSAPTLPSLTQDLTPPCVVGALTFYAEPKP